MFDDDCRDEDDVDVVPVDAPLIPAPFSKLHCCASWSYADIPPGNEYGFNPLSPKGVYNKLGLGKKNGKAELLAKLAAACAAADCDDDDCFDEELDDCCWLVDGDDESLDLRDLLELWLLELWPEPEDDPTPLARAAAVEGSKLAAAITAAKL